MNQHAPLRFHPRLVEEAVFLSLKNHSQAVAFYSERNRLYEIADPDKREQAFLELHRSWFLRLALARPIEQAIGEQPSVAPHVRLYAVGCASGRKEEGVELFVSSNEGVSGKESRTVQILLRPESLLDPAALLPFLRRELYHITDMLDPHFGYEPALPGAEDGPSPQRLLRDRYRALWDATIDGRLVRCGRAPESARAERLVDFSRAFPMFGEEIGQVFGRFFDAGPHTHAGLLTFACDPKGSLASAPALPAPGSRCPLCGFVTYGFVPEPEGLPLEVTAQIHRDFPCWHPSHGLCIQCADLYRARALSLRAAQSLPGTDRRE